MESVTNITAKFRLHTRIKFDLVKLFIYFVFVYLIHYLKSDIELNPGPKSSLSSGLLIRLLNLNILAARNFSEVTLLEVYNSIHSFDIICLSETSYIQLFNWIILIILNNNYTLVLDPLANTKEEELALTTKVVCH